MRLLLDENASPRLAETLVQAGIDTVSLQQWRGGAFLRATDDDLLAAAAEDGRVLLTADRSSISVLVRELSQSDQSHAGVVFLRGADMHENAIGDVTSRLTRLASALSDVDWNNRTMYLPR